MRAKLVLEAFREDSDPIEDMGIGIAKVINDWIQNLYYPGSRSYVHQPIIIDGKINARDAQFKNTTNFPDYIRFNKIKDNFMVRNSPEFTSLEGIPTEVSGDFIFYDNGIQPSENDIRKICNVGGYIMLVDKETFIKNLRHKKYKELGPVKDRPSPVVNYNKREVEQKYSRGYIIWSILNFIESYGDKGGARYTDILKFIDKFKGNKSPSRSLNMGNFNSIKRYTFTENARKFLNSDGLKYLSEYREAFDKT